MARFARMSNTADGEVAKLISNVSMDSALLKDQTTSIERLQRPGNCNLFVITKSSSFIVTLRSCISACTNAQFAHLALPYLVLTETVLLAHKAR
jgi:hypothetical protein